MANDQHIDIDLNFSNAKKDAKSFFSFLSDGLKQSLKSGSLGQAAGFVGAPIKQEFAQAKNITIDEIQQQLLSFALNPIRGTIRQIQAIKSAREQTIEQIGILGGKISQQSVENLYNANYKITSMEASAKTRVEGMLTGFSGPAVQGVKNSLQAEVDKGVQGLHDKGFAVFDLASQRFSEAVESMKTWFQKGS